MKYLVSILAVFAVAGLAAACNPPQQLLAPALAPVAGCQACQQQALIQQQQIQYAPAQAQFLAAPVYAQRQVFLQQAAPVYQQQVLLAQAPVFATGYGQAAFVQSGFAIRQRAIFRSRAFGVGGFGGFGGGGINVNVGNNFRRFGR